MERTIESAAATSGARKPLLAKLTMFALVAALVCLAFTAIGCAPQKADDAGSKNDAISAEGEFVSDEQCMSCHGGSYEAVAELTADMGDWNPHDSIHGGYSSCVNCHERDQEITRNYCSYCHNYGELIR